MSDPKVQCSLFSESLSTGVGEGGSSVSASSCKIEGTIFGLRDNLARREHGMGLRDAAGVTPAADKCTPGFSFQCLISPQECCGVQEFMTMTPPLGSGSSVPAPQRLLLTMDLVATNPQTPVDLLTTSHFVKNSESRKDLIQELLSDSTVHCEIVDCLTTKKLPIIDQLTKKNSIIHWMNITKHYPVDENAFSAYGRGTRVGQP
jgi:hypothetical protein